MQVLLICSLFALATIVLCMFWPRIGRIFYGLFFLAMAGVNIYFFSNNPTTYATAADNALIPAYKILFELVVGAAPAFFALLLIAYEIALGLLLLSQGRYVRWGIIMAITFLLGITPMAVETLGNIGMALALGLLLRMDYPRAFLENVWRRGRTVPRRAA